MRSSQTKKCVRFSTKLPKFELKRNLLTAASPGRTCPGCHYLPSTLALRLHKPMHTHLPPLLLQVLQPASHLLGPLSKPLMLMVSLHPLAQVLRVLSLVMLSQSDHLQVLERTNRERKAKSGSSNLCTHIRAIPFVHIFIPDPQSVTTKMAREENKYYRRLYTVRTWSNLWQNTI